MPWSAKKMKSEMASEATSVSTVLLMSSRRFGQFTFFASP